MVQLGVAALLVISILGLWWFCGRQQARTDRRMPAWYPRAVGRDPPLLIQLYVLVLVCTAVLILAFVLFDL